MKEKEALWRSRDSTRTTTAIRKSRGHNNPKKSTPITTGTYKKPETRRKQAIAHEDTDPQAQDARNEWHDYDDPALKNISKRDRVGDSARNGSDSNSDRKTRGH